MDEHAVKVVKGDEMVGHLLRKFSWIVWYFLARSGFIMFNLYLLKVFSSISDNNKPVYSLWKEWSHV